MTLAPDFTAFKNGAGRDIFRKLGLADFLEAAESWRSLRRIIIDWNDPDKGRFVDVVRQCDGVASSGERTLLHAICYTLDFAWLADELAGGYAWRKMGNVSGRYRDALAACILAD